MQKVERELPLCHPRLASSRTARASATMQLTADAPAETQGC